jgi:hypothetical protein
VLRSKFDYGLFLIQDSHSTNGLTAYLKSRVARNRKLGLEHNRSALTNHSLRAEPGATSDSGAEPGRERGHARYFAQSIIGDLVYIAFVHRSTVDPYVARLAFSTPAETRTPRAHPPL